jgi:hypothetical protein
MINNSVRWLIFQELIILILHFAIWIREIHEKNLALAAHRRVNTSHLDIFMQEFDLFLFSKVNLVLD